MQSSENIILLLLKRLKDELTEEEVQTLSAWESQYPRQAAIVRETIAPDRIMALLEEIEAAEEMAIKRYEKEGILPARTSIAPVRFHLLKTSWFRYAAILILIAGVALYLYSANKPQKEIASIITKEKPADILPGGNKATLTLSDGSIIVLDSASKGSLAQQGNTKIIKVDAASLAYNTGTAASSQILYNTISTPKGGQYQIVLPDGSKVWLNAASSIKFPTAFSGDSRNVEITGEAYFEVMTNVKMPFHVKVNDVDVLVLGTHFNINAYEDEKVIRTTLLEGSVKVYKNSASCLIAPGEQARTDRSSNEITIKKGVDTDEVMAWKNGLFQFDKADIETIMRQMARWYDIDVVFDGPVPDTHFQGKILRNEKASNALKVLEAVGIHFKIDGKKVIVTQ